MEEKVQDEGQVIIGRDASLKTVFDMVRRVARTNSTVLVTGESGTGKELVVQTLHNMSGRKGPFVPVNCGGISPISSRKRVPLLASSKRPSRAR